MVTRVLIPQDAMDLISKITDTDEGGWILSHTKNDNDGGWTYAGVTSKVYLAFIDAGSRTYEEMQGIITYSKARVDGNVYQIYYQQYYLKVASALDSANWDKEVTDYMLSCAVNCGVGGFISVLNDAITLYQGEDSNSPTFTQDFKSYFLRAWKSRYQTIASENPSDFGFLEGWINRVNRYA